jgi:hypothetical protein
LKRSVEPESNLDREGHRNLNASYLEELEAGEISLSYHECSESWLETVENEDSDSNDEADDQSLSPEEAADVSYRNASQALDSNAMDADANTTNMIEIFPGFVIPLLGSQETIQSFQDGTAVLVPCTACQFCLFCASRATMVLSPHCRDISPVSDFGAAGDRRDNSEPSVGLGMSIEESFALMES